MIEDNTQLMQMFELINELSSELHKNREMAQSLQSQVDELKEEAVHAVSGFTLRRYNTDISKEHFELECERINAEVIKENQLLQFDNKQLTSLVKEFEGVLETIMDKFRQQSYSTQLHELELIRYYEGIIQQLNHTNSSNVLNNSISYNKSLNKISVLISNAMACIQDSEANDNDNRVTQLEHENAVLRQLLGISIS